MTNKAKRRCTSRPALGRYTPPGLVQPTPPRSKPGMCHVCDAEARGERFSFEDEERRTSELIERYGMMVTYVSGEGTQQAWGYTIGRLRRGLPELITIGLDPSSAHGLLTRIDEQWGDASKGPSDDDDYCLVPVPSRVWHTTDYLLGAIRDAERFPSGAARAAVQVVWADPAGRFPWDRDVDARLKRLQPVLGLRSVAA